MGLDKHLGSNAASHRVIFPAIVFSMPFKVHRHAQGHAAQTAVTAASAAVSWLRGFAGYLMLQCTRPFPTHAAHPDPGTQHARSCNPAAHRTCTTHKPVPHNINTSKRLDPQGCPLKHCTTTVFPSSAGSTNHAADRSNVMQPHTPIDDGFRHPTPWQLALPNQQPCLGH
jgi:hypothetical protein